MTGLIEQDFGSELDAYIAAAQNTTNQPDPSSSDWEFDPSTNLYVIHSKQLVMVYHHDDQQWSCGVYSTYYNPHDSKPRYQFNNITNTWLDTITGKQSIFDSTTQSYVPLTDESSYWSGQPQSNLSIRLVMHSSPHYKTNQVVLLDETGLTVGRDRLKESTEARLRLPEMMVSKYHARIYFDNALERFCILDVGSQHGTFVNKERLSEAKMSSLPRILEHGDRLKIGSTNMEIHWHPSGRPCDACVTSEFVSVYEGKKKNIPAIISSNGAAELEKARREWIRNTKKMYSSTPAKRNNNSNSTSRKKEEHVDRDL